MNITVFGLWHLGSVTAACLASAGHCVIGLDPINETIAGLQKGKAPVMEPGLDDLLGRMRLEGRLVFTTDVRLALAEAELVWVTFDTPVDEQDVADVEFVVRQSESLFEHLRDGTVVIFSSQIPVGTTGKIEATYRQRFPGKEVHFGYIPENLRLGKAIECFTKPDRFVVGTSSEVARACVATALAPITDKLEHMSTASAEMTKHAINSFLAMCVVFANELAGICEQVGADAKEVERGLKSEMRIGRFAYLSPGSAFAGGTLARDVRFLEQLGLNHKKNVPLIGSILESNECHKQWVTNKLREVFGDIKDKTFAVLGLTYKPDTSTLRRSSSVETCRAMSEAGARIQAFDPGVTGLPSDLSFIRLMPSAESALEGADALLVQTQWDEFKKLSADLIVRRINAAVVVDPNGFLDTLQHAPGLRYFAIGRNSRT